MKWHHLCVCAIDANSECRSFWLLKYKVSVLLLLNIVSPQYCFFTGHIKTIHVSAGCLTKVIAVCVLSMFSPLPCVLRERGDYVSIRMEGLCHRPLLLLHRHHPPRRGAGVPPGCKTFIPVFHSTAVDPKEGHMT